MSDFAMVSQSIERCVHNKENPYLMISVGVTRDTRLSVEDIGFLTVLLDHPNNFKFNVPYLVKRCKLSKEKTRKLLNRLIDMGYVIANQIRQKGQFLGMIYRVFEKPLTLVKSNISEKKQQKELTVKAVDEKSVHGKSVAGEIDSNNYDQELNTRENKKNKNVCMSYKILKIDVDSKDLKNALLIRNVQPIKDQNLLNAYLEEFNKNADQFSELSEIQRIANFAVFIKRCIENNKTNVEKSKKPKLKTGIQSLQQAYFFAKQ